MHQFLQKYLQISLRGVDASIFPQFHKVDELVFRGLSQTETSTHLQTL